MCVNEWCRSSLPRRQNTKHINEMFQRSARSWSSETEEEEEEEEEEANERKPYNSTRFEMFSYK